MGAAAVPTGACDRLRRMPARWEFIVGADYGFYFMEINLPALQVAPGHRVRHRPRPRRMAAARRRWRKALPAGAGRIIAQRGMPSKYAAMRRTRMPGSCRIGHRQAGCACAVRHVRLDGVVEGDTVTIFYDPMIAKLIVGRDRHAPSPACAMRWPIARSLARSRTSPSSSGLVQHPAVVEWHHTGYLDRHLDEFLAPPPAGLPPLVRCDHPPAGAERPGPASPPPLTATRHRRAVADGWRLSHGQRINSGANGTQAHANCSPMARRTRSTRRRRPHRGARRADRADGALSIAFGRMRVVSAGRRAPVPPMSWWTMHGNGVWRYVRVPAYRPADAGRRGPAIACSPDAGAIVVIRHRPRPCRHQGVVLVMEER